MLKLTAHNGSVESCPWHVRRVVVGFLVQRNRKRLGLSGKPLAVSVLCGDLAA